MKTILAVLAVAALGGCAVAPPAPVYYGGRAAPVDPYQWHTVSVEPAGATRVEYSSEPVYAPAPVYAPPPVYAAPVYAAPVYAAPAPSYYYPPVTIGLDFVFGNWCCGHRWGGRGYYRHR